MEAENLGLKKAMGWNEHRSGDRLDDLHLRHIGSFMAVIRPVNTDTLGLSG